MQSRIRADIARFERLGYEREHLCLARNGKVLYDTEAVDVAAPGSDLDRAPMSVWKRMRRTLSF